MPSLRAVPELVEGPQSPTLLDYLLPSFFLIKRKRKIKAKTIGLPHGQPKRLTFKSGSDFYEVKRKRPSLKVKRLVRPLGDHCPAFWPCLPAQPSGW